MEDGRFEALGRGIYRTFETDPKQAGETQAKLLDGLKGVKTFLEAQLPLKIKDAENCPPDVAAARRLVVDNIREEIKWVNEAIVWFNEGEMHRKHFDFAQWEANEATKK